MGKTVHHLDCYDAILGALEGAAQSDKDRALDAARPHILAGRVPEAIASLSAYPLAGAALAKLLGVDMPAAPAKAAPTEGDVADLETRIAALEAELASTKNSLAKVTEMYNQVSAELQTAKVAIRDLEQGQRSSAPAPTPIA